MKSPLVRLNSFKSLVILIVVLLFLAIVVIGLLFTSAVLTTTHYRNNAYDIHANSCQIELSDLVKRYSTAMRVTALNPTIRENIFRRDVTRSEMIQLSQQLEKAVTASTYLLIDQEYLRRHVFYCYLPTDGKYFFTHDSMQGQNWYPDFIKSGSTDFSTFVHDPINSEYQFFMLQIINDFNLTQSGSTRGAECYETVRIRMKGFFAGDAVTNSDIRSYPYLFSKNDGTMVYAENTDYAKDAQAAYDAAMSGHMEEIQGYRWNQKLQSGHIPTILEVPSMNAYLVVLFEAQPFGRYLSGQGMLVSVLFLMGLFLLTLLLLLVFYVNFKKRINRLVYLLDSFDGGNSLTAVPNSGSGDEIGKIERHTVQMQSRLKTLIEEEYKVKLQNISAQYEVLTAYINPHFLYNTLNSISAMASLEGAEDTQEMVLALSEMFRYSADMRRHQVLLLDELKNVQDYLYIQGIRYRTNFVFRVEVPEQTKTCVVPKLILQPIVENCFKHGFNDAGTKQSKEVILSAVSENNFLKIYVMDNGKGMDADELAKINRMLAGETYTDKENSSTEIGLSNVNRRLKLLYGDGCGVQVSCEAGKFTCVKLTLLQKSS